MALIKARHLEVLPCPVSKVRHFIEENHYSKSINGVKVTQCFCVYYDGLMVGAVLFGQLSTTAWKKFGGKEAHVLELRRLVLLDDCGKNSESFVIGSCIRWIKKHLRCVRVIVSYADPMYGHTGVIYRASNFKYIGVTQDDKGYIDKETGKLYHSRALRTKYKGDYKPFVKKLRAKLEEGLLETVNLAGKHCYIFVIKPPLHITNNYYTGLAGFGSLMGNVQL